MYRDEHEAALRRAEALEREVRELRATASTSAGVAERLGALERELAERREQAAADARRLSDLQRRVDALRAEAAGGGVHIEPGIADCQTGILQRPGPRRAVAAALALGALALAGGAAAFWLVASARDPAVRGDDEAEPATAPAAPLSVGPREARARELYAEALRREAIGDVTAARELLDEAAGIFPALPEVHRALARFDLDEGAEDDACAELAIYEDLAPEDLELVELRNTLDGRCVDGELAHTTQ
jgi:hypothetical protein